MALLPQVVETTAFTRAATRLWGDAEYRELQRTLIDDPELGAVIAGSGGLRKLRWGLGGHGKRGGARVIYYWAEADGQIFMLVAYAKSEVDNLTRDQLKLLRRQIE